METKNAECKAAHSRLTRRPINLGRNHWKLSACHTPATRSHGEAHWHVAPLTWGGIIGNSIGVNLSTSRSCRPINLGRNHWKRVGEIATYTSALSRPINLGRNHWKRRSLCFGINDDRVAPLTWGGIIGNAKKKSTSNKRRSVAPLTWGGIIGNSVSQFA